MDHMLMQRVHDVHMLSNQYRRPPKCTYHTLQQLQMPLSFEPRTKRRRKNLYLGSTLDPKVTPHNPIANHLTKGVINWQILSLLLATYKPLDQSTDPKVIEWKRKLAKAHPEAIIHTYPHQNCFYNKTTTDQKK